MAEWLVAGWVLITLVSDLLYRRIPNLLSIGAALFALLYLLLSGHAVLGATWQSVLLGTLLGLGLTLPAYGMRWLGAGDVKLMLAIGLLGGLHIVVFSFVVAGLLAGAAALAWLYLARFYRIALPPKRWLPFGAALLLGLLPAIGARP